MHMFLGSLSLYVRVDWKLDFIRPELVRNFGSRVERNQGKNKPNVGSFLISLQLCLVQGKKSFHMVHLVASTILVHDNDLSLPNISSIPANQLLMLVSTQARKWQQSRTPKEQTTCILLAKVSLGPKESSVRDSPVYRRHWMHSTLLPYANSVPSKVYNSYQMRNTVEYQDEK